MTFTYRGKKSWPNGIPSDSTVRIVALPIKRTVIEEEGVTEQLTVELDPGKYIVKVRKSLGKNINSGCNEVIDFQEEIFHGITKEEWVKLNRIPLLAANGMQTSKGFRLRCNMGFGCKFQSSSHMSMLLHEAKHLGVSKESLMEDPEASMMLQSKAESLELAQPKKVRTPNYSTARS